MERLPNKFNKYNINGQKGKISMSLSSYPSEISEMKIMGGVIQIKDGINGNSFDFAVKGFFFPKLNRSTLFSHFEFINTEIKWNGK